MSHYVYDKDNEYEIGSSSLLEMLQDDKGHKCHELAQKSSNETQEWLDDKRD
jgi:hypothetical protein